jgi:hypothetical protein
MKGYELKPNRSWPPLVTLWSERWEVARLAIFAFDAKGSI